MIPSVYAYLRNSLFLHQLLRIILDIVILVTNYILSELAIHHSMLTWLSVSAEKPGVNLLELPLN
jgi:hypothetical protein